MYKGSPPKERQNIKQKINAFLEQIPITRHILMIGNQEVSLLKRQAQCAYLAAKGYSAKEIGKLLGISYRTVEHYLDYIKNKTGITSKRELISLLDAAESLLV